MKEGYVIYYWNGEQYDDGWSGVLDGEGVFTKREDCENRIKQLQIDHDHRIKEEISQGYAFPPHEKETWQVQPINIH